MITVVANLNILGNATTFLSRQFHLLVYSDVNAHETVRIESTQNGNIIGGQFDFKVLRLPERIGYNDIEFVVNLFPGCVAPAAGIGVALEVSCRQKRRHQFVQLGVYALH